MIRVLIVGDSSATRARLREILDSDPDIEVVGEASTGLEGVATAASLSPDLVTMDMAMPDIDGLEATRRIMSEEPVPVLFVASNLHYNEINVVFEALHARALDLTHGSVRQRHNLVEKVKALAKAGAVKRSLPESNAC